MKQQKLVLQLADSKTEGIGGIKLSNNCDVGMLHSNNKDPLFLESEWALHTSLVCCSISKELHPNL